MHLVDAWRDGKSFEGAMFGAVWPFSKLQFARSLFCEELEVPATCGVVEVGVIPPCSEFLLRRCCGIAAVVRSQCVAV